MEQTYSFRPAYGQALTIAIAIAVVVTLALTAPNIGVFVRYLGPALLIAATTWALFWRPNVEVDDDGVTMRNVLRTVRFSWPAIDSVDTKYALTLGVGDDKYTAWAAPAPGFVAAKRASRADQQHLPTGTYAGASIRPGDLASSLSGQAAMLIRRYLEQRHQAVSGGSSSATIHKTWNWDVVIAIAGSGVWSAISLLV